MSERMSPDEMTRIFNWGVAVDDAIRRVQSGVEGRAVVFPVEKRSGSAYLMPERPSNVPTMFYVKVEAVDVGYMP